MLQPGCIRPEHHSQRLPRVWFPMYSVNLSLVKSSPPFADSGFFGCITRAASATAKPCEGLLPPAHPLVSGQIPHSLSAGCHCPSLPCQGKGTSLHILPNLSPQHKLNTCTGRVFRSIPWMDWNWSGLGSTYIWCCSPRFWERCNHWWETAVGVVSDTSWEAPSPGCGVAATWAQGELCGAARRPGPCSKEGCLALSKCKRMRQGKTQVFVLVPREKDITVHLVLPLANIKWENKVKCNCYASMVVPFLQWGMKALTYINDCKRCRGKLCAT